MPFYEYFVTGASSVCVKANSVEEAEEIMHEKFNRAFNCGDFDSVEYDFEDECEEGDCDEDDCLNTMEIFPQEQIKKAEEILRDNGIDEDETSTVLQAIGYALLNVELYPEGI